MTLKKLQKNSYPDEKNIFDINPKNEPLTISVLKSFEGCNHYTDEEAAILVESIRKIAAILYDLQGINKSISIDNQQPISLNNNKNNKTQKIAA